MRAESPQAFLDRLGLENRFQWFMYGTTLYVSPLQNQDSTRLEVSADAVPDMKQALTDIGLLDPRFGWGERSEENTSELQSLMRRSSAAFCLEKKKNIETKEPPETYK